MHLFLYGRHGGVPPSSAFEDRLAVQLQGAQRAGCLLLLQFLQWLPDLQRTVPYMVMLILGPSSSDEWAKQGYKKVQPFCLLQDNSDEQYSLQSPLSGWLAGSMLDLHGSLALPSIQSCFLPLVNILHLKLCFSICFPKNPTCDGQPHSVTSSWGIFSIFCLDYGNSLLLIVLLVFNFSELCFILYIIIFLNIDLIISLFCFINFPYLLSYIESSKWHLRICTTWLYPKFQILFLSTSFCPTLL